jgi:hypothetical protein
MRKILFVLLALIALVIVPQWSSAAPDAAPSASPTPAATPKPKKASLFHRMLYGTPEPTPAPKESPTPRPKSKWKRHAAPTPNPDDEEDAVPARKAKATPKPKATPEPEATPTPTPKPEPTPTPTPAVSKKRKGAKGQKPAPNLRASIPVVPENSPPPQPSQTTETLPPLEQDAKEKAHLKEIKATALEDADIKALKDKADAASDSDQQAASKAYYKALYEKMRSIDPMMKERIDRTEAAMMKQLDGGTAQ